MITFLISILLLIAGYFVYGKIVERFIGVDPLRKTPAYDREDGIDYMPMPTWKVFVIQFLNIAGLGPIFGAVMGAAYGPAAYLWIVLGCIFMGAVHDFFAGMMSIESSGANMPDITGKYLGKTMKGVMSVVVSFLLLAVGVSFVTGPSDLIASLTGVNKEVWLYVIFAYYLLATLLPIDKIIGNIYPYMGAALLFMALGVGIMLVVGALNGTHHMIELTPSTLKNWHFAPESNILVPMLFIVVSCGAISGFHSTQSPLMARCLTNEKQCRPVFYGALISESIIALIWAAIAMAFWGGVEELNEALAANRNNASILVDMIANETLGHTIAIVVMFGVIGAAITSGDTAYRSARLMIADALGIEQKTLWKRIVVCLPIFALAVFIILATDFRTLWSYFAWFNQTLSVFTLWAICIYLVRERKPVVIAMIPAVFMTYVCSLYLFTAGQMLGLANTLGSVLAGALTLVITSYFIYRFNAEVRNAKTRA